MQEETNVPGALFAVLFSIVLQFPDSLIQVHRIGLTLPLIYGTRSSLVPTRLLFIYLFAGLLV